MSIATMTPDMEKALRYHWINENDSKFVIKYNNIIKPVDSIKANRDCKFGIRCNRENCWFRHPKGRWIKKEVTKEFDSFYDAKNWFKTFRSEFFNDQPIKKLNKTFPKNKTYSRKPVQKVKQSLKQDIEDKSNFPDLSKKKVEVKEPKWPIKKVEEKKKVFNEVVLTKDTDVKKVSNEPIQKKIPIINSKKKIVIQESWGDESSDNSDWSDFEEEFESNQNWTDEDLI